MVEKQLGYVQVPLGMTILLCYHVRLLFTIIRNPRRTVIGINSESRRRWVFCLMASIRYDAHVSFLATVPTSQGRKDVIEYVARNLNRGSFFWSLGLRAFYLSFPLFLWVLGPIPMFVGCFVMSFLLYFLDTTTNFTRDLHTHSIHEETNVEDVDSVRCS